MELSLQFSRIGLAIRVAAWYWSPAGEVPLVVILLLMFMREGRKKERKRESKETI